MEKSWWRELSCGMANTFIPALYADSTPISASSSARQSDGLTPALRGLKIDLGVRLAVRHLPRGDDSTEPTLEVELRKDFFGKCLERRGRHRFLYLQFFQKIEEFIQPLVGPYQAGILQNYFPAHLYQLLHARLDTVMLFERLQGFAVALAHHFDMRGRIELCPVAWRKPVHHIAPELFRIDHCPVEVEDDGPYHAAIVPRPVMTEAASLFLHHGVEKGMVEGIQNCSRSKILWGYRIFGLRGLLRKFNLQEYFLLFGGGSSSLKLLP